MSRWKKKIVSRLLTEPLIVIVQWNARSIHTTDGIIHGCSVFHLGAVTSVHVSIKP